MFGGPTQLFLVNSNQAGSSNLSTIMNSANLQDSDHLSDASEFNKSNSDCRRESGGLHDTFRLRSRGGAFWPQANDDTASVTNQRIVSGGTDDLSYNSRNSGSIFSKRNISTMIFTRQVTKDSFAMKSPMSQNSDNDL